MSLKPKKFFIYSFINFFIYSCCKQIKPLWHKVFMKEKRFCVYSKRSKFRKILQLLSGTNKKVTQMQNEKREEKQALLLKQLRVSNSKEIVRKKKSSQFYEKRIKNKFCELITLYPVPSSSPGRFDCFLTSPFLQENFLLH